MITDERIKNTLQQIENLLRAAQKTGSLLCTNWQESLELDSKLTIPGEDGTN
jgi:hypothetical protein